MQIEDNELAKLTAIAKEMHAEYLKMEEVFLEHICAFGKVLRSIKKVGNFKKGGFNAYVRRHFDVSSSWRCAAMKLDEDRGKIAMVREWGLKHGLKNVTPSDVYRLLCEYEKRDKLTDEPRKEARKYALELTDVEKREVCTLHAIWADEHASSEEADRAELALYRTASAQGMLIKKLLKKANLKPPHKLETVPEEGPFSKQAMEPLERPVNSAVPSVPTESAPPHTFGGGDLEHPPHNAEADYSLSESNGAPSTATTAQTETTRASFKRKSSNGQKAVAWGDRHSPKEKAEAYDEMRVSHAKGIPFDVISRNLRVIRKMSVGPTKIERLLAEDQSLWASDLRECVRQIDLKQAA